ncbi:hypothetical protein C8R44DRAFT_738745 [Mycena epipterygia]|nr:hypothetical protein C8R44DRAFT_738745 [Mycena epipterygia]
MSLASPQLILQHLDSQSICSPHDSEESVQSYILQDPGVDAEDASPTRRCQALLLLSGCMIIFHIIGIFVSSLIARIKSVQLITFSGTATLSLGSVTTVPPWQLFLLYGMAPLCLIFPLRVLQRHTLIATAALGQDILARACAGDLVMAPALQVLLDHYGIHGALRILAAWNFAVGVPIACVIRQFDATANGANTRDLLNEGPSVPDLMSFSGAVSLRVLAPGMTPGGARRNARYEHLVVYDGLSLFGAGMCTAYVRWLDAHDNGQWKWKTYNSASECAARSIKSMEVILPNAGVNPVNCALTDRISPRLIQGSYIEIDFEFDHHRFSANFKSDYIAHGFSKTSGDRIPEHPDWSLRTSRTRKDPRSLWLPARTGAEGTVFPGPRPFKDWNASLQKHRIALNRAQMQHLS